MQALIEKRIRELAEAGALEGIVSVYLFGSVASGTSHHESDVDLGVLLSWDSHRTGKERFDERLRLISLLEPVAGTPVDVVILNDAPPTFGRKVATGGKRILCSDPEGDHTWVRDVQLRAADIDPFLDRMRRIKLEVLSR